MQGDEVRLGNEGVEADQSGHIGLGHVRVVGEHPQAQRGRLSGDQRADPTQADQAESPTGKLDTTQRRPLTSPGSIASWHQRAGEREEKGNGQLGHSVGVRARRGSHGHPVPSRRFQVDPVCGHAVAGHHPQPRRTRKYLCAHLVEATEQTVGIADGLRQLGCGERAGTVADHAYLSLEPAPQARVVHAERPGRHDHHAVGQRSRLQTSEARWHLGHCRTVSGRNGHRSSAPSGVRSTRWGKPVFSMVP